MESAAAARADFSNVLSGVRSTEASRRKPRNSANDSPLARQITGQPQERGNGLTRLLGGIGGRQVMQGAAGVYGALGGDALNHYVLDPIDRTTGSNLGTGGRTYRDAMGDVADRLGMHAPQTATGRVASDIGEALSGTALTMGAGAGVNMLKNLGRAGTTVGTPGYVAPTTNRLADLLSAQPGLQATTAAGAAGAAGIARENGATEAQQGLAALVGGLAPTGARQSGSALTRLLARGRSPQGVQDQVRAFNAVGAFPTVGQAAGNWRMQGLEGLLSKGPTTSGVMGRAAERQADDIGGGLQQMAHNLYPNPSAQRAGLAIKRGAETFKGNTSATTRALYWQADKLIPDTVTLPLQRTQMALAELTTPNQGAMATTGALVNPKIAQMAQNVSDDLAANGGAMPYAAVKELRSRIGESLNDYSLTTDKPTAEYKRLYAALSQDMEEAARAQGPNALQAAKRANAYYRAASTRLKLLDSVVRKAGGPEKVYQAAIAGTRDGASTLRSVMHSLPQDGKRALTAAVIKRMGLATPGKQGAAGDTFSAQSFLSNWNRFSPEAKAALFGAHGPKMVDNLDRLAKVTQTIKQSADVFANPSHSAEKGAAVAYWGSLGASLLAGNLPVFKMLAATGVGTNLTARLLVNPRFVSWLAHTTTVPQGAYASQIATLREMGERDDDEDLQDFADLAKQAEHKKQ